MRALTTPHQMRTSGQSDEQLTQLITKLGLDYSLMSQWTSFVAVSEKIANEHPETAVDADVPLNQVKGVSEHAYEKKPETMQPAPSKLPVQHKAQLQMQPAHIGTLAFNGIAGSTQSFGFGGSSAPEPGTIGAMILLVLMMTSALLWGRRRRV